MVVYRHMQDDMRPAQRDAETRAFLDDLDASVRSGGVKANSALAELSGIATGGNLHARELIARIDADFGAGRLKLPDISSYHSSVTGGADNLAFFRENPLGALDAACHQLIVNLETEDPPPGQTIEGFGRLPLREAAAALEVARAPSRRPTSGYIPPDRDPGDF